MISRLLKVVLMATILWFGICPRDIIASPPAPSKVSYYFNILNNSGENLDIRSGVLKTKDNSSQCGKDSRSGLTLSIGAIKLNAGKNGPGYNGKAYNNQKFGTLSFDIWVNGKKLAGCTSLPTTSNLCLRGGSYYLDVYKDYDMNEPSCEFSN